MARTTAEEVEGIVEVETDDDLTFFIDTANEVVTDNCASSGYTDAKLKKLEMLLAAHFYRTFRLQVRQEQAGPVMEQFDTKVGLGLDGTTYGQAAKTLDKAGNLARLDLILQGKIRSRSKTVTWLGMTPAEKAAFVSEHADEILYP